MATQQPGQLNSLTGDNLQRELDSAFDSYRAKSTSAVSRANQNTSYAGDIGSSLISGAQRVPGMLTGLADIPAGLAGFNRPFSRAADVVGEATGFQPGEWADARRSQLTPETQSALQRVQEAQGFWGTLGAYGRNPKAAGIDIAESAAPTLAGGFAGAAVKGAAAGALSRAAAAGPVNKPLLRVLNKPVVAAGIGEGAIAAGGARENIDESVDPFKASLAALTTGVGVGTIAGLGAQVASKIGLADPELIITQGGRATLAPGVEPKGFFSRVIGGGLSEGVLQEMPQGAFEQIVQNAAEDKPLFEGVDRSAVSSLVAGFGMGAGANLLGAKRYQDPTIVGEDSPTDDGVVSGTQTPADKERAKFKDMDVPTLVEKYTSLQALAPHIIKDRAMTVALTRQMSVIRNTLRTKGVTPEDLDETSALTEHTNSVKQLAALQTKLADTEKLRGMTPAQLNKAADKAERLQNRITQIEQLHPDAAASTKQALFNEASNKGDQAVVDAMLAEDSTLVNTAPADTKKTTPKKEIAPDPILERFDADPNAPLDLKNSVFRADGGPTAAVARHLSNFRKASKEALQEWGKDTANQPDTYNGTGQEEKKRVQRWVFDQIVEERAEELGTDFDVTPVEEAAPAISEVSAGTVSRPDADFSFETRGQLNELAQQIKTSLEAGKKIYPAGGAKKKLYNADGTASVKLIDYYTKLQAMKAGERQAVFQDESKLPLWQRQANAVYRGNSIDVAPVVETTETLPPVESPFTAYPPKMRRKYTKQDGSTSAEGARLLAEIEKIPDDKLFQGWNRSGAGRRALIEQEAERRGVVLGETPAAETTPKKPAASQAKGVAQRRKKLDRLQKQEAELSSKAEEAGLKAGQTGSEKDQAAAQKFYEELDKVQSQRAEILGEIAQLEAAQTTGQGEGLASVTETETNQAEKIGRAIARNPNLPVDIAEAIVRGENITAAAQKFLAEIIAMPVDQFVTHMRDIQKKTTGVGLWQNMLTDFVAGNIRFEELEQRKEQLQSEDIASDVDRRQIFDNFATEYQVSKDQVRVLEAYFDAKYADNDPTPIESVVADELANAATTKKVSRQKVLDTLHKARIAYSKEAMKFYKLDEEEVAPRIGDTFYELDHARIQGGEGNYFDLLIARYEERQKYLRPDPEDPLGVKPSREGVARAYKDIDTEMRILLAQQQFYKEENFVNATATQPFQQAMANIMGQGISLDQAQEFFGASSSDQRIEILDFARYAAEHADNSMLAQIFSRFDMRDQLPESFDLTVKELSVLRDRLNQRLDLGFTLDEAQEFLLIEMAIIGHKATINDYQRINKAREEQRQVAQEYLDNPNRDFEGEVDDKGKPVRTGSQIKAAWTKATRLSNRKDGIGWVQLANDGAAMLEWQSEYRSILAGQKLSTDARDIFDAKEAVAAGSRKEATRIKARRVQALRAELTEAQEKGDAEAIKAAEKALAKAKEKNTMTEAEQMRKSIELNRIQDALDNKLAALDKAYAYLFQWATGPNKGKQRDVNDAVVNQSLSKLDLTQAEIQSLKQRLTESPTVEKVLARSIENLRNDVKQKALAEQVELLGDEFLKPVSKAAAKKLTTTSTLQLRDKVAAMVRGSLQQAQEEADRDVGIQRSTKASEQLGRRLEQIQRIAANRRSAGIDPRAEQSAGVDGQGVGGETATSTRSILTPEQAAQAVEYLKGEAEPAVTATTDEWARIKPVNRQVPFPALLKKANKFGKRYELAVIAHYQKWNHWVDGLVPNQSVTVARDGHIYSVEPGVESNTWLVFEPLSADGVPASLGEVVYRTNSKRAAKAYVESLGGARVYNFQPAVNNPANIRYDGVQEWDMRTNGFPTPTENLDPHQPPPPPARTPDGEVDHVRELVAELHKVKNGGSTTNQVLDEIRAYRQTSGSNKQIIVHQTLGELLDVLRAQGKTNEDGQPLTLPADVGGYYTPSATPGGRATIHMVADNIQPGTAIGVLLHEVSHKVLLPAELSRLGNQIRTWADQQGSRASEIAKLASARVQKSLDIMLEQGREVQQRHIDSELIAYFVQIAVTGNYAYTLGEEIRTDFFAEAPNPISSGAARINEDTQGRFIKKGRVGDAAPINVAEYESIPDAPLRNFFRDVMNMVRKVFGAVGLEAGKPTGDEIVLAVLNADSPLRSSVNVGEDMASVYDVAGPLNSIRKSYASSLEGRAKRRVESAALSTKRLMKYGLAFGHDVRVRGRKYFKYVNDFKETAVDLYFKSTQQRGHERRVLEERVQKVLQPVQTLTQESRRRINKYIAASTLARAWGFTPEWAGAIDPQNVDPTIEAEFLKLLPAEQAAVKRMFQVADEMQVEVQNALREQVQNSYDRLIAKETDPEKVEALFDALEADLSEFDNNMDGRFSAWMPLRRYGKYYVAYISDELKSLMSDKDTDNTKEIRAMKGDRNHYVVSFNDSRTELNRVRDQILAKNEELGLKGTVNKPAERMQQRSQSELIPFNMMTAWSQALTPVQGMDELGQDINYKVDAIRGALEKIYIQQLAETSARKSELERLDTPGFDEDMIFAFDEKMRSMAGLVAALRTNEDSHAYLQQIKDEAADRTNLDELPERMEVLNELLDRHALVLDYTPTPYQNTAMGFTSLWMLITSPGYFMQNAMQVGMLTYPILMGEYGVASASNAIKKGYGEITRAWMSAHKGTDWRNVGKGKLFDMEQIANPLHKKLLQEAMSLNLLDVGMAADLGSIRTATEGEQKFRLLANVHSRLVHGVRSVEVVNRGVTGVATFDLEYAKQVEGETQEQRYQRAQKKALETIEHTQGDYAQGNRPSAIRKLPIPHKVITQFRPFQLIQLTLLARMIHSSVSDAGVVEKAIARRQLMYVLGMHGAIGGFMALPGMGGAIGWAIAMAVGDDEEPNDIEMQIRARIGDEDISNLILNGFPAYFFDTPATMKLGMGQALSIMPFTDIDLSKDGLLMAVGSIMGGATAAQAGTILNGFSHVMQGNWEVGVADMLPRGPKDLMKGIVYSTQGVRRFNATRDVVLTAEEVTFFDGFVQALGWPSAKITNRQNLNRFLTDTRENLKERSSTIKGEYVAAWEENDRKGMDAAKKDWLKFQAARVRMGFKRQPMSLLTTAPREKRKREAWTELGVPIRRTERGFIRRFDRNQ